MTKISAGGLTTNREEPEKESTMAYTRIKSRAVAKTAVVAVLGTTAFMGVAATPAAADGKGNSVFNCYGIWYSRDWNQACGTGGAGRTGYYQSKADCDYQPDKTLTKYRDRGNGTYVDGVDCRHKARGVFTSFY